MDAISPPPKAFSWSYSRLKAFEDCPRRYFETQVKKDAWPEEPSEILQFGDAVHKALAHSLRTGVAMPTRFKIFQHWVDKLILLDGEMLIETQWAITKDMQPTAWFAKDVWLRCIADAIILNPPLATVIDWKAGKSANADPVQLLLTALMIFHQFPDVHGVLCKFIWLQENSDTELKIRRHEAAELWSDILPRVKRLETATKQNNFPPMPNRFCRSWCPVRSCEYHGK